MLGNEDTLNINAPSKGMQTKLGGGGHRIQNAQQGKKNEGEDIKIIKKLERNAIIKMQVSSRMTPT